MAYVPVPKDLSKVKTKVMFNLTKRQLLFFGGGALVGVPLFLFTKGSIGTSMAAFLMIFVMLPFFLFAMYEKHGQPFEVILKHYFNVRFIRHKQRPYQTDNFYAAVIRQANLDKEVYSIVRKDEKKTDTSRKETDRRSH